MRSIKFRAWDKKKRLMIYDIQNAYDMYKLNEDENNQKNYEQSDIYYDEAFRWILENNDVIIEQFTGLTDKNGKDIYEGDYVIVGTTDEEKVLCEVFFDPENACFCFRGQLETFKQWLSNAYEIEGNIHEEEK